MLMFLICDIRVTVGGFKGWWRCTVAGRVVVDHVVGGFPFWAIVVVIHITVGKERKVEPCSWS